MSFLARLVFLLAPWILSCVATTWAQDLRTPSCDELAEWLKTLDANDRWEPVASDKRIWLPTAMSKPAFTDLFGKPALEWTQADVASARTVWGGCIQLAKKSRDNERRSLLEDSRPYLTTNLRNLARNQDRLGAQSSQADSAASHQQARDMQQRAMRSASQAPQGVETTGELSHPGLRAGVDELLKVPPSLDGLITLGSLSRLDISDPQAMEALERQFGNSHGAAGKAGYRVMRELRFRGTAGYEKNELPRIMKRLGEVKPAATDEFKREFSQVPTDPYAKRALEQRYEKVMAQLERALSPDEYQAIADAAREDRLAIVDQAVTDARAMIDKLPPGIDGIAEIDRIVNEAAKKGLNNDQRLELVGHARSRQQEFANQLLIDAAEKELPSLPGTIAGIQQLNSISTRMLQGVVQKADRNVVQKFVAAADAKLAEIGRAALAEYRQALAKLPENEGGLARAEREVLDKEGWVDMEEGIRDEYVAIAASRRDDIARVVSKERAKQGAALERERQSAIAAGGDPRLVGTEWIETNKTMKFEFRDEETVFINAMGIKAAGTYKVSRDDVVVTGPHGQLVYTLEGNRLTGMGLTFIKQEK